MGYDAIPDAEAGMEETSGSAARSPQATLARRAVVGAGLLALAVVGAGAWAGPSARSAATMVSALKSQSGDNSYCLEGSAVSRDMVLDAYARADVSGKMNLKQTIHFTFGDVASYSKDLMVSIEYHANHSSLTPLWSDRVLVTTSMKAGVTNTGEVHIMRLRAKTGYTFSVWVQAVGEDFATKEYTSTFTTVGTGYARFDDQPLLTLMADTPSFEMATFAVYPAYEVNATGPHGTGAEDKEFEGLIAVDAEGWVVWYYHTQALQAWDFTAEGDVILLDRSDGSLAGETSRTHNVSGAIWNANSQMQIVSNTGNKQSQFIQECTGHPLNYNQLGGELRIDSTAKSDGVSSDVLTVTSHAVRFPNVTVTTRVTREEVHTTTRDTFIGGKIARWNRESNELETIYDMFDISDPHSDMIESANWATSVVEQVGCSGEETLEAIDFHHISSVTVGNDGNFIVASRNLDTVWSLNHDGSGVAWTFSSSLSSTDFGFGGNADKFFSPYDVHQMPNGNIVMIDDGTNRPGCAAATTAGCWSRAIQYSLNPLTLTADVVWQFEFPFALNKKVASGENSTKVWEHAMLRDAYNTQGGSVAKLPNGNYLISLTSVSDSRAWNPAGSSFAFEIDLDGAKMRVGEQIIYAKMVFPTPSYDVDAQNGFRFKPWSTINGETISCPFGETDVSTEGKPDAGNNPSSGLPARRS